MLHDLHAAAFEAFGGVPYEALHYNMATVVLRRDVDGPGRHRFRGNRTLAGDSTVAAALLDRLLQHAHIISLQGERCRLKDKRNAGLIDRRATAKTEG